MPRCYSGAVTKRHILLPAIWLVSDARNDAGLETALKRLPRGSGFIYRHYHLPTKERRARFKALARIAWACGHVTVLAGTAAEARRWGANGCYGGPRSNGGRLHLATAHSLRELRRVQRADAVLLSAVFATSSHPRGKPLGPLRFRMLAAHSPVPVIALGGIEWKRARQLGGYAWAAVDGLS